MKKKGTGDNVEKKTNTFTHEINGQITYTAPDDTWLGGWYAKHLALPQKPRSGFTMIPTPCPRYPNIGTPTYLLHAPYHLPKIGLSQTHF